MCFKHPEHTDIDIIASKIELIGRAYSAAIERKAGKKFKSGKNFCRDIVAPAIRNSEIDFWLKDVRDIKRLTEKNIGKSLRCHKHVTDLFKKITGLEKRSLASKYLHFHAPNAFFIYDSIANRNVKERIHAKKFCVPVDSREFDNEYAVFSCRCLKYRDKVEKKLGGRIDRYETVEVWIWESVTPLALGSLTR
jgi:hypothetical protein